MAAAGLAIGAITDGAPEAELIVIGPAWPDEAVPAGVRNNRDVIRSAAEIFGATFVDPITEGWLVGAPELVCPDGEHLTAAADAYRRPDRAAASGGAGCIGRPVRRVVARSGGHGRRASAGTARDRVAP